jgi:hypothetical protein
MFLSAVVSSANSSVVCCCSYFVVVVAAAAADFDDCNVLYCITEKYIFSQIKLINKKILTFLISSVFK